MYARYLIGTVGAHQPSLTEQLIAAWKAQTFVPAQGAFGTQLKEAGVVFNNIPTILPEAALWSGQANLGHDHDEIIKNIHKAYAEAGALCLLANTYDAYTRYRAAGISHAETAHTLKKVVRLARWAADEVTKKDSQRRYVGASVAPYTDFLLEHDRSKIQRALAYEHPYTMERRYHSHIQALLAEKPDYLQLECISSLAHGEAMARAAEKSGLPVILSFTPELNVCEYTGVHRLLDGTPLDDAVIKLKKIVGPHLVALGVNCRPAETIAAVAPILKKHVGQGLLAAFPNGSDGHCHTGSHCHQGYVQTAFSLAKAGYNIIGGCCGTRPQDIAAMALSAKIFQPQAA